MVCRQMFNAHYSMEEVLMKMHTKLGISLMAALALVVSSQTAFAARINGQKCAGMVSKQKNPKTGETTRSCRTADGSIATEKSK